VIWVGVFYLVLAMFTFWGRLLVGFQEYLRPGAAAGGLGLAITLVWRMVFCFPDGLLHLTVLDVGTSSAIFLQTPAGHRILINGGSSSKLLSDHLGRRLPPFQRKLDYLVITSPQEQDIDALAENIIRYPPEEVLWLGSRSLCWEAENLRSVILDRELPLTQGEDGQYLVLDKGVLLTILNPGKRGGTLLIEYGSFRALLPFGVDDSARQELRQGRSLGRMTVLLLEDNGYQSSNPSAWIQNLNPQLVLLSVGVKDNRGLPDRGMMDRLGGYSLLRTDEHGSIHLATDGNELWVEVERLE
jgi:competence protein ComEC